MLSPPGSSVHGDSPGKNTGVGCHAPPPAAAAAAAKSLQSCPTLGDPIDGSPPGSAFPGIPQPRSLEWLHCLLQCMKVKSESEVAQSCRTLSDPMDCSPPGSSVHGVFQARVLEWGASAFSALLQGICQTQGRDPGLPDCRWILYHLSHHGSPRILEWVAFSFSSRSSQPRG